MKVFLCVPVINDSEGNHQFLPCNMPFTVLAKDEEQALMKLQRLLIKGGDDYPALSEDQLDDLEVLVQPFLD